MEAILLSFKRGLAPIRALLDCQILYKRRKCPTFRIFAGFSSELTLCALRRKKPKGPGSSRMDLLQDLHLALLR